jgi:nitrogen fixation protein NifX
LRVAIASQDGKMLDAHFGYARRLMVYDVTSRTRKFVEAIAVEASDSPTCDAEEPDRIGPKVRALAGCQVLFALAIGPPAGARVIRAGIHPITLPEPEPIRAVLGRVQAMMNGEQPVWLARLLRRRDDDS